MGIIGVDPDKYYKYTLKELEHISSSFGHTTKMIQSIPHSIYDVQYGFDGKKVFKDSWLRRKFPVLYNEERVLSPDEGNEAIKAMGLVKSDKK